jgi:hypothetical protein
MLTHDKSYVKPRHAAEGLSYYARMFRDLMRTFGFDPLAPSPTHSRIISGSAQRGNRPYRRGQGLELGRIDLLARTTMAPGRAAWKIAPISIQSTETRSE